jgi:UDP-N-acetyl-D-mannosaminuronic acid transferase (WecB/TagA/CpsF family)
METISIFGMDVQTGRPCSVIRRVKNALLQGEGGYSIAANVEKVMMCRK